MNDFLDVNLKIGDHVAVTWSKARLKYGTVVGFTPKKIKVNVVYREGATYESLFFPYQVAKIYG